MLHRDPGCEAHESRWIGCGQADGRGNTDTLAISELNWMVKGRLIHMTIISTTVGKNPFEEMG